MRQDQKHYPVINKGSIMTKTNAEFRRRSELERLASHQGITQGASLSELILKAERDVLAILDGGRA